jgi:hypothetical protein
MDISKMTPSNKVFAISSGLTVGVACILIFKLIYSPVNYTTLFYNINFLGQGTSTSFIVSIFLFSVSIISAGVVTTFLLSKKNCILGGITGSFIIILIMILSYSFGTMQFPIFPQIHVILGYASIPLVFLIYAIPTSMIGFILGYLGSYLAEHSYVQAIS